MRLSDLELSCVDIIALFELLVVGHVFTKTLNHHSVPVLYVGLAVALSKHMLCIFCIFVPTNGLRSRHRTSSLRALGHRSPLDISCRLHPPEGSRFLPLLF